MFLSNSFFLNIFFFRGEEVWSCLQQISKECMEWHNLLYFRALIEYVSLIKIINSSLHTGFFYQVSSVQFSHSVVSDSFQPHGLHHTRLPCPSPTPRAYSNSCPSSWWCHPTISSSVVPFSSCPQSFPASGSFQMSQFLSSDGKRIDFQLQHQAFQWIFRTDLL